MRTSILLPFLLVATGSDAATPPTPPCDSLSAGFDALVMGLNVNFFNADNPAGTQYSWNFGDGNTGLGPDPDHAYGDPGSYLACLIAWWPIPGTSDTCFVDHCEWVTVGGGGGGPCDSLSAGFDWDWTGGNNVQFENPPNPAGTQYSWNFGDGNTGLGPDPAHIYDDPGSYLACLIASWPVPGTNDTCVVDHCEWITVGGGGGGPCDSLSAEFDWDWTGGNNVQFENPPNPAGTQYSWNFGDGSTGAGPDPDHTYDDPGSYLACLIAWWPIPGTSDTCFVDHCEWVTVGGGGGSCDGLLEAAFNWDWLEGTVVQFVDLSFSALDSPTYEWWFGDGTTSDASDPLHTYPEPGTYYACLTVSAVIGGTADSCFSTTCDTIAVGPVGMGESGEIDHLSIWPTPFNDLVTIDGSGLSGELDLTLFDARGRKVAYRSLFTQPRMDIDFGGLAPGAYVLRLADARGVRSVRLTKE